MAHSEVYNPTTAPTLKGSWFLVPTEQLDTTRFLVKVAEVAVSFVAFLLEELVPSCFNCSALYFFEFVSCSSFLFTLLLLLLLATTLHHRVSIAFWPQLDLVFSCSMCLLLFVSSSIFSANNTGSGLEKAAVAFGFLACASFLVDVILFLKTHGFPFHRSVSSPDCDRSVPVSVENPAEREKLNNDNQ